MQFPSFSDRVLVTVTGNPGTGSVTVGSAVTGYQSFPSWFSTLPIDVCIFSVDSNGNPSGLWEVQRDTLYGTGTLTRSAVNVVDGSSGPGVLVNFSSGTQRVMMVHCSERIASTAHNYNYLINGGFSLAQRQVPGTFTTIASDKYSADRWRCPSQSASLQYSRIDTATAGEAGLVSRFYGAFKQITNAGKFMICQPIEGSVCIEALTAGGPLVFQLKMKASSAKTINMGIIAVTSGGTVDVIPGTMVTSWNVGGSDPTLATNLTYRAPAIVCPGANGTVSGSVLQCSVTTSWQQFGFVFTGSSSADLNLIPVVWTSSQFSANDVLYLAEAGLYQGQGLRPWFPRLPGHEILLAQRYYEKSSDIDVSPTRVNAYDIGMTVVNNTTANGQQWGQLRYQVPKRVNPTVSIHPYTTGTDTNKVSSNTGTDFGADSGDSVGGVTQFAVQNNSGGSLTTSSNLILFKFEADAEL